MLDRQIVGKVCALAITVGENIVSKENDEEFNRVLNAVKTKKLYSTGPVAVTKLTAENGYLDFPNAFPVLQFAIKLPDFRFRMFRKNMIQRIVTELVSNIDYIERRLKTFEYESISDLAKAFNKIIDVTAVDMIKYLEFLQHSVSSKSSSDNVMQKYGTQLDQKFMSLQKHEIHKIYQLVRKLTVDTNFSQGKIPRKVMKMKLVEAQDIVDALKKLFLKISDGWPDVIIWLLSGGSRVAYTKLSAADIIYSILPEQSGKFCSKIQSFYMKPLKCPKHMNNLTTGCFCLAGKVDLFLWMGLLRQRSVFFQSIPSGYNLITSDFEMCLKAKSMIIECRCYIYRAKLSTGLENSGLADTFVRINVLNEVKQTQVKTQTFTPVWNQVLKINKFVFISKEILETNPPIILVEVYNKEFNNKTEIVGRVQVRPFFDNRMEYEFAPKLQWYELHRGVEYVGQLLMSSQIIQVPETLLKTTMYSQGGESEAIVNYEAPKPNSNEIETLPQSIVPKMTTYKLDVYWWGLRNIAETRKPCVVLEIDELSIKSEIILEKKTNCNFPNGRISHEFEAPLKEVYCPPLSISLFDTTTFGRTVFLGTNVIKNPNKYLVKWLPKSEREASLNSASFVSSNYAKVNEISSIDSNEISQSQQSIQNYKTVDIFRFSSLLKFSTLKKQKTEEQINLLPMITRKKRNNNKYGIKKKEDHSNKDWWLRFYCSQKECPGEEKIAENDKIIIYKSELECQLSFSKFKDWCTSLRLYNGKKTGIPEKDEKLCRGLLKAGIAIYKWPPPLNTVAVSSSGVDLSKGFFTEHPNNDTSKFLVRVYIVKGFNLMPKDISGKSDPYIILNCGKKKFGDRKNYLPKTLNPIFGKLYEFRASMPDDFLLTISIFDYDVIPPDDLIGCTTIDLEDRIYTKHRATCGLSANYNLTGINKWRDCMKPSAILKELCAKNHIPQPIFTNTDTVLVNGIRYNDDGKQGSKEERKENICLGILRDWNNLPICGYTLVPEHVETRTLFNPDKPGLDQGKLQLWVDIFPLDTGYPIPPGVNIAPRKVEEFELRVIVWDVEGITLDDYDIITGQKSSDIYVKTWIGDVEHSQQTDIHYRSLTGIGNFNWRMIFKIQYQHAERKILTKQISLFSESEDHVPPFLYVQVMDSDAISADDFLGSLTLNLNSMTRGAKTPKFAKSAEFVNGRKINLFTVQSLRGWWPLKFLDASTKKEEPAGVIDLELTLLPIEIAMSAPAGLGREAPQPLPMPKRPETSFNMFMNPFMYIKMFSRGTGWKMISGLICLFLLLTMLISAYLALPRILLEKWLGKKH